MVLLFLLIHPPGHDKQLRLFPSALTLVMKTKNMEEAEKPKTIGRQWSRSGCRECKRRKKKCDQQAPNCGFCQKKNIQCVYPDIQILEIQKTALLKRRNTEVPVMENETKFKAQRMSPELIRSPNVINSTKLSKILSRYTRYTDEVIFQHLFDGPDMLNDHEGAPNLHLTMSKIDFEDDVIKLKEETTVLAAYDDTYDVHNITKVPDCILSSMRVNNLDKQGNTSLKVTSYGVLRNMVSSQAARLYLDGSEVDTPQSHQGSLENPENYSSSSLNEEVFDDLSQTIDLEVSVDSLKKVIYIQSAAVSMSKEMNFINLPSFITQHAAFDLFEYFTKLTQVEATTDTSWLQVCFPLFFTNITVLKAALLYAAHHCRQFGAAISHEHPEAYRNATNDGFLTALYNDVLLETKDRLNYTSSVCCDHSVLLVHLLLSVEMLRGNSRKLWIRYMKCLQNMISLRGGVTELSRHLTGRCLLQLLSYHLFSSISIRQLSDAEGFITWPDYKELFSSREVAFYDQMTFFSNFSYKFWQPIFKIYGEVLYIYHLLGVYGTRSKSLFNEYDHGYEAINGEGIEGILTTAYTLKGQAKELKADENADKNQILLFSFYQQVCELYISQLNLSLPPNAPVILAAVKKVLVTARKVFDIYKSSGIFIVPLLPLMSLGVYIVGLRNQQWYKGQLALLADSTRKTPLKDVIELLDAIWEQNPDGKITIDWISMMESREKIVPLYV